MEVVSLIYTNKIKPTVIGNYLKKKYGFCHSKRSWREEILQNTQQETSIKVNFFKIEIMYKTTNSEVVASLIEGLSEFNYNKKISIKTYYTEDKSCIKHFLGVQKYYFI